MKCLGCNFSGDAALGCPDVERSCARHPSQLYEATLEGLLLFLLLIAIVRSGALYRPGLTTAVFAVGYGLSRFFVEYFRVPDPQFFSSDNPYGFAVEFASIGMTMGQVLTLPMILAGLCIL